MSGFLKGFKSFHAKFIVLELRPVHECECRFERSIANYSNANEMITIDAIIFENRFEGIAQPRMHHFEKSLFLS